MRTLFTPAQLADPAVATSEKAIRACVHCGFCNATCPTFVLLGDERDSPRGRVWLIKEMLEKEQTPTPEVVRHIDRCLSCLACTTTCPSGVDYMHLIDHARARVEQTYQRPAADRFIRWLLAAILPYPKRFAAALSLGRLASPLAGLVKMLPAGNRLAAMLRLAARERLQKPTPLPAATGAKGKVILQSGCAEPVLRPHYQDAVARLLTRAGYEVVRAENESCCGGLVHHMGRDAHAFIRRNVEAWSAMGDVAAILITASGCGVTVKDYGFMLRNDPLAQKAARISSLAKDISEFLPADLPLAVPRKLRIAWHSACSLQHGQKITAQPKTLLERAGFEVVTPADAHLCCGSAGTYNILQPEIAARLGDRKAATLAALKPDLIATSNVGCAVQLGSRAGVPVVHIAELLDWASGGPPPKGL